MSIWVPAKYPHEIKHGDTNKNAATKPAYPAVPVGKRQRGEEHVENCFKHDCAQKAAVVHDMFLVKYDSNHEEAEEPIPSHNHDIFKSEVVYSQAVPHIKECHAPKSDSYEIVHEQILNLPKIKSKNLAILVYQAIFNKIDNWLFY